MKNRFIAYVVGLSVANAMLVGIGVALMPTLLWAWAWAIGCLVLHFVLLVTVAAFDLRAVVMADHLEFTKRFSEKMSLK